MILKCSGTQIRDQVDSAFVFSFMTVLPTDAKCTISGTLSISLDSDMMP